MILIIIFTSLYIMSWESGFDKHEKCAKKYKWIEIKNIPVDEDNCYYYYLTNTRK